MYRKFKFLYNRFIGFYGKQAGKYGGIPTCFGRISIHTYHLCCAANTVLCECLCSFAGCKVKWITVTVHTLYKQ